uniref:MYND-type domain-containing protein n=1 Tax=Anopheles epiroticus TaxID=199890 RepID=A0A182PDA6_9DIPT
MHVMEDSDDAVAVSSDTKAHSSSSNLKPAFAASPKGQTESNPQVSTTIVSTDSQKETKDTESTPAVASGGKENPEAQAKQTPSADNSAVQPALEKSSNAISSTTTPTGADDKMPTATAVEVPEKIADSSDDAVSVHSSSSAAKKTVTTAITPTVNSSASTETVEQKSKLVEDNSAGKAEDATSVEAASRGDKEAVRVEKSDTEQKRQTSPSPGAGAEHGEPTADDVMAGIDDFMEQNGDSQEGGDGKEQEDFNDDLTFQMDVDEDTGDKRAPKPADKNEESAMDLTSSCEQTKENRTTDATSSEPEVRLDESLPVSAGERRASVTSQTKERNVDMHDKTVVTSTPVNDARKAQQERSEREQEGAAAASSSLEVKQEQEEEAENVTEAQNLSKQKPSARDGGELPNQARKTVQPEAASRKRRRSVETEEERRANEDRSGAESEEPIEPAKKLKLEVEANYQTHERVVSEYIDTTQNTSVDEIQNHTDALVKEIQTLNDMIRDTELKWNNLLHLKKVKEEILLRLNRRKHVIGIMDTRLGELSVYSTLDSSNLSSQHHPHQQGGRSSSVGPRPPTPPPEVEIRPASVTSSMHYGYNASPGASGKNSTNGGDKPGSNYFGNSLISNRRSSSSGVQTGGKRNAKDTNSFVSQFNSSNNAVTMLPLPQTTSMILNARASMNAVEVAKEKSAAVQIQRQILPKPVLSNHQQILNNLAMSAGLTGNSGSGSGGSGSNGGSATVGTSESASFQALFANTNLLAGISQALLNGHHHNSSGGSSATNHQQQLQIGRQGMRKDVSSIIADYRQKHPENVPRRGRRLKNVGGGTGSGNNGTSSAGNSIGTFGEGGAISLTALSGAKSPANARPNSTDSVANRISELLAAAETSRPSSNDSSQSQCSNLLSSLMSATGAPNSSQQFFKDVLAQFAKMSQNEQNLLSNLQFLTSHASTTATNTVSSPQQSPQQQQQQQHHQQQHHHQLGSLHQQQSSLLSKASLPEVTLHPVMNSTANSDVLGSGNVSSHGNGSLTGANLSAVNSSTNSLLHGILTKSASRPGTAAAAAAAAAAVGNFNTFSPTLARLLTVPERMSSQSSSSSTVTSGALANLQSTNLAGGLNLSKSTNEISITPVVGSNFQQTLLAQQQQQHQQQLQRLREQQLYNLDDEADDSADRLVIDEGDDVAHQRDSSNALLGGKRRGAEINENEVPQCQGCKKQEAKFVCAGCGNQWYCSRACQVILR